MGIRFLTPGIMLTNVFNVDLIERFAEPTAEERIIKATRIRNKIIKYLIVLVLIVLQKSIYSFTNA
ncbi:hypothetical protein LLG07_05945 [bacterium]|nr:hypothetical protein [bacterium]